MPRIEWAGRPGNHNRRVSIDHGRRDIYTFSLCNRVDEGDPHLFRVFVYRDLPYGGWLHVGGFDTLEDARAGAERWEDPYPDDRRYLGA